MFTIKSIVFVPRATDQTYLFIKRTDDNLILIVLVLAGYMKNLSENILQNYKKKRIRTTYV